MPLKVTILGATSAKPSVSGHPSAQAVNVSEQLYLVDAGEGVQQQMFRNGLNPLRLRAVFISHLHGDHVFGLFPLLSTMGLYGRQVPLKVFAPAPFGEILEGYLRWFDDHLPYTVEWVEVDTTVHEKIFENRTLEVWSIPLRHSLRSAGYLFREKEAPRNVDKFMIERHGLTIQQIVAAKRGEDIVLDDGTVLPNGRLTYVAHPAVSYAYCSDTSFSARAAEIVAGVDLLYHEATYAESERSVAGERGHSTAKQAAEIARRAGAGRLLIGHFSSRYKEPQLLLDEARSVFARTDIAVEGQTFEAVKCR